MMATMKVKKPAIMNITEAYWSNGLACVWKKRGVVMDEKGRD